MICCVAPDTDGFIRGRSEGWLGVEFKGKVDADIGILASIGLRTLKL